MAGDCLKELARVEKLLSFAPDGPATAVKAGKKAPTPSIATSLDALLESLHEFKHGIEAGATSAEAVGAIARVVDEKKKEMDDKQKEMYNALSKLAKALDKRFPTPLPEWPPMFTSQSSAEALDRTVALHLIRTGQFATAATFVEESGTKLPDDVRLAFHTMHAILDALRRHDIGPALQWAVENRAFLASRDSDLEFALHRSHYMRMLVADPAHPLPAITYLQQHTSVPHMTPKYQDAIIQLLTSSIWASKIPTSPYKVLLSDSRVHGELEAMLAQEFCARLGMSRQLPLMVVADVATGGALGRIEKARKVMKTKKHEWTAGDELPIETPLAPEHRYHSLFVCPVSKEQSTATNPPMMMSCGHVVAKESLTKLTKPGGRVKCPYCPVESRESDAIQVYF